MFFSIIYGIAQPLLRLYFRLMFGVKCIGIQNVPKTGGLVVSANHKSNFDPPLIGGFLPRRMGFLSKRELFSSKFKRWFLNGIGAVPYSRGSGEIGALKAMITLLKEEKAVSVFPEGTRGLKDINQVKSGAILFAIKAQVPILPTAIVGDYQFRKQMKVIFGKPKYYEEFYGTKPNQQALHQLAMELITEIYQMVEAAQ